jgi:hypothetical protein
MAVLIVDSGVVDQLMTMRPGGKRGDKRSWKSMSWLIAEQKELDGKEWNIDRDSLGPVGHPRDVDVATLLERVSAQVDRPPPSYTKIRMDAVEQPKMTREDSIDAFFGAVKANENRGRRRDECVEENPED